MKLFPTNSFSPGQNQSDSPLKKTKDDKAFASLMQEESTDWSRTISNDTRMGRADEAHEAVSRQDQAAQGRRKAENRDTNSTKTVRGPKDSANTDVEASTQESPANVSSPSEGAEEVAAEQVTAPAEATASNGESTQLTSGEVSTEALGQAAAMGTVPITEMLSIPALQVLGQVNMGGLPVTEANPLVGATLLSPAALGGIEGLDPVVLTPLIGLQSALSTDQSKAPLLAEVLPNIGLGSDTPNGPQVQVGPQLFQNPTQQPVLDAALALRTEELSQQLVQQVETLPGATESAPTNLQSPSQTAHAMLGGSVFQELAQKGQHTQLFGLKDQIAPATDESEGTPVAELPEIFQEAKGIWTNVDARSGLLRENAEVLAQLHNSGKESDTEVESEGESSTMESTRPLQGLQQNASKSLQQGIGNQSTHFAADVAQEQSLNQRIEVRAETQSIQMQEVAPTPEGYVAPLTEVMVEVDDDLRVNVRTTGREVAVSIDGTTRAVEEMRGIGPELQESLENLGFTLSEFTTNEDAGEEASENGAQSTSKKSGSSSAESTLGPLRQVRHGARIDTTA
jgi:hypothetical protein